MPILVLIVERFIENKVFFSFEINADYYCLRFKSELNINASTERICPGAIIVS